ncbi:mitochondrial ribosomal protein L9 isoform X2 [Oratosquilla oratoria]|uniref:mitochondrial ribosomal protein L9 isoform X2 n=1 Tax=Oratosquilla oratoria TaxID=337810 RepID=UPI003F76ECFE
MTTRTSRMISNLQMLPSLSQSMARLCIRSTVTPLAASAGCSGTLQIPTPTPFPGAPGQQARTTFILKRRTPPQLVKAHKNVGTRKLRPRNFVYELVEDTNTKPQEKIKILLLEPCEGVGSRGDVVEMKPTRARRDFLLPKRAVYASPENMKKYETLTQELDKQDQPSSPFALQVGQIIGRSIHTESSPQLVASRQKKTARKSHLRGIRSIITHHFNLTCKYISSRVICVAMNMNEPWQLERWHIRVALRKSGIIVPEDAITIPNKPIVGPDLTLQGKEFFVTIKINNKEEASVRCRIHHMTNNLQERIPWEEYHWLKPAEPIFPEQAPVLKELFILNKMAVERLQESEH